MRSIKFAQAVDKINSVFTSCTNTKQLGFAYKWCNRYAARLYPPLSTEVLLLPKEYDILEDFIIGKMRSENERLKQA